MPTLRLLPELEDAIRQIPGVRAVSVVTDPQAHPTEVHVLAAPGKPAKQVVRDVQSLALARYDIDIDHRIVSVVQIGDDEPAAEPAPPVDTPAAAVSTAAAPAAPAAAPTGPTPPGPANGSGAPIVLTTDQTVEEQEADEEEEADEPSPRPVISEISVRTTGSEAEAEVTLTIDGHTFVGSVQGSGAATHRPRLVAQATLAALADLLGVLTEVEAATFVDTGTSTVALTVITVTVPRIGPQSVSGSAVVRGDDADAVARSVLDALNRRLTG